MPLVIFGVLAIAFVIVIVTGFRKVTESERGVILRGGRRVRSCGPGLVFVPPFDRFERVSIEPFSVSVPPQSAITKDEIPIQLVASLDAKVTDSNLAVLAVRDWRIFLMSQLQELMKERLEDLDFDNLEKVFPDWVKQIQIQLSEKGKDVGVEVTSLQISNLSPRTKPDF
jgi:regulator of protease activity HflC (stomatin/prohibitin superfamily)